MQDLVHNLKFVQSIAPVTKGTGLTGDVTKGSGIDMAGFDSCMFTISIGAALDASDVDYKLQDSDTDVDGDYVDVAAAYQIGDDVIINLTQAAAASTLKKGYIGTKRYVRAVATLTTGGSGSWPHSVHALLGHARKAPVA